jgi:hypothetical protein
MVYMLHANSTSKNWLGVNLPLWQLMEVGSWAEDIPNIWKVINFHGSTNQYTDLLSPYQDILSPMNPYEKSLLLMG